MTMRIRLQVQITDNDNNPETRTGPATSVIVPAPRTLVSNFGQTGVLVDSTGGDASNGFVTGAHPLGYTIGRIGLWAKEK